MIHMKNVHVTYPGGMTALHPSSLHFRQGEFTVLLGASGAGKSTLLRCLNQRRRLREAVSRSRDWAASTTAACCTNTANIPG